MNHKQMLKVGQSETAALHLLREAGFAFCQELDWIAQNSKGRWIIIETKFKSRMFHPPPFWGLGLDLSQVFLRRKLHESLSIRTYLLVFCKGEVYGQFLDKLLEGSHFTTKANIQVFPVEAFVKGIEPIMESLNE